MGEEGLAEASETAGPIRPKSVCASKIYMVPINVSNQKIAKKVIIIMQTGMLVPQELLNSVKKTKTSPDEIQAMTLKSAIMKDNKFHVRYNPATCQLRVFRNSKPAKEKLNIWDKFIADGRKRMKACDYYEWCQNNDRDPRQPVKFNTKNGAMIRIADVYQVTKIVEWSCLGLATDENINSHDKVW